MRYFVFWQLLMVLGGHEEGLNSLELQTNVTILSQYLGG